MRTIIVRLGATASTATRSRSRTAPRSEPPSLLPTPAINLTTAVNRIFASHSRASSTSWRACFRTLPCRGQPGTKSRLLRKLTTRGSVPLGCQTPPPGLPQRRQRLQQCNSQRGLAGAALHRARRRLRSRRWNRRSRPRLTSSTRLSPRLPPTAAAPTSLRLSVSSTTTAVQRRTGLRSLRHTPRH